MPCGCGRQSSKKLNFAKLKNKGKINISENTKLNAKELKRIRKKLRKKIKREKNK